VVAGRSTWRLGPDGGFSPVPPLEPGAVLAGDVIAFPTRTGAAARFLTDEIPLWKWDGRAELVGADPAGVYLVTDDRTVLGLSPLTGRLIVLGCAAAEPHETWEVGHFYGTGEGYVALERVTGAPPGVDDQSYYFGPRPVALVELYAPTKLPVWPGKFASCTPS
jgi:hypothetical protein